MNKRKLKWVPSVTVALIVSIGACMKLAGLPQLAEVYSRIGMLPFLKILGIAELLFMALFLFDRSLKISLLLLTGYFGGAMAVELSHGTIFVLPAIILSIIWIGAYLRNPLLFLTAREKEGSTILHHESL